MRLESDNVRIINVTPFYIAYTVCTLYSLLFTLHILSAHQIPCGPRVSVALPSYVPTQICYLLSIICYPCGVNPSCSSEVRCGLHPALVVLVRKYYLYYINYIGEQILINRDFRVTV